MEIVQLKMIYHVNRGRQGRQQKNEEEGRSKL
jgi:hypothetical protein